MKLFKFVYFFLILLLLIQCENKPKSPQKNSSEFTSIEQTESGKPTNVRLTSYSTTLIANGKDFTHLRIAVTDSIGREITSASDSIMLSIKGDGSIRKINGTDFVYGTDSTGTNYAKIKLVDGKYSLLFIAGTKPDKVKVEAKSGTLWPGTHEIHTLPSNFVNLTPSPNQLLPTTKPIDKMIGADISFLPQMESRGKRVFENGKEIDAIDLLKEHGFNYIRLRIFVNPENEKGYSPKQGFCGLSYTLKMAKRVQNAGMKLLLDFHYSDYWADPQQQNKPFAWANLDYETLKDSVTAYTTKVLLSLKKQGTMPAMIQVGNEINHGMLWPDGHISNPDGLAGLLKAGIKGVNAVDKNIPIMMHIALGGQNDEAVFWLNNMIARGVKFDIIGLSYYPQWHGRLEDLKNNLNDLIKRYHKPVNVVEYSEYKKEVNDIVFNLPNNMGKGTAIWEPLGRSGLFTKNGEVTNLIAVYDTLNKKYIK